MFVLTAFFTGHAQAESATSALAALGVPPEDISVFPRRVAHARDIAVRASNKAFVGASAGAVLGSALAAVIGSIAGAGALVVPAFESVMTGSVVAAFAFAGAGGGLGLLVGSIIGARFRELEVRIFADAFRTGGVLVAVRCPPAIMVAATQVLKVRGASLVYKSNAPR